MRVLGAVALVVLLVAAGAWTGLCAVAVNGIAWALLLGVAATAAAIRALPGGRPRLAFTAGWLGVLVLALLGRPEGDWAIVADWHGYTLLGAGVCFLAYGIATVPRRAAKQGNGRPPT